MQMSIHAIGRMRGGPEAALVEDYLKRARDVGRNLGFSGFDIHEFEVPRGLAGAARQGKEGDWLASSAGDAVIIALDERGKDLKSEDFAAMLENLRDQGARKAAFLIGGADGHNPAIIASARRTIAFSKATWPHMLVRAMLAEQLYRSMTILSGHPYHRS